jgi:hypothetical protein
VQTNVSPLALMNFNTLAGGMGMDTMGGAAPASMPVGTMSYDGTGMASAIGNAGPTAFGAPAPGGFASGLGGPLGVASLGLSALSSLGSLWMGLKANKLAKKQFKFTKDVTNTNLANQIQSYNTALADRARSRGVMEGQTQDQVAGYINANALSRNSGKNGPASTSGITAAALSNYSNYVRPTSSSSSSASAANSNTPRDDEEAAG